MNLSPALKYLRRLYNEYPPQFRVLIGALFIDRLGGALIFPFLTLYITRQFGVGMTEVGIIFGLFSLSSVIGSMISGALTDHLGRKQMLVAGLVISALTSLFLGVAHSFALFCGGAVIAGLFSNIGGPAQQAMVADLLPEKQRAQGFGLLRVVANLAVTIGPAIGGLLAGRSYLILFISDAVLSTITAAIVCVAIKETRPVSQAGASEQTVGQTFRGYGEVLRDTTFILFIGASILMVFVYMQMNSTLAVYLRDIHGIPDRGFGYLLSLNAALVVLFQFPVTRRIAKYRPLRLMAAGSLLYTIGFGMYGFVSTSALFVAAMLIITVGELLTAPTGQALVAHFAPEDMRGRYMAVYGFSWVIPFTVGPLLAGLVMDNADPRWVWYAAGLTGLAAAGAFALLQRRAARGLGLKAPG
ncbi:MAG: MFS transporter [Chloroflexota bacterium]|nr:MFS transporter [Chloroflexota bacterium]